MRFRAFVSKIKIVFNQKFLNNSLDTFWYMSLELVIFRVVFFRTWMERKTARNYKTTFRVQYMNWLLSLKIFFSFVTLSKLLMGELIYKYISTNFLCTIPKIQATNKMDKVSIVYFRNKERYTSFPLLTFEWLVHAFCN